MYDEYAPPSRPAVVSVWPRLKAQVIDVTVIAIATGALLMAATGQVLGGARPSTIGALALVVGFLYFTLCEWRGQTIGKKFTDIEVRSAAGGRPNLLQAFVRTVFRAIDGLGLYVVGAAFVWASPRRQRLGDRAAGTIVVRSRPDAPTLRNDGTHSHGQAEAESFNVAVQSEIGRPPHR